MRLLDNGIIQYEDYTNWNSPLIIVRKRGGGIHLVNNFISLNKKTVDEQYLMNDPDKLLSRVAGGKYLTRLDLHKAFFQINLSKRSQKYGSFHTPFGVFSYRRMAMGLKCASFTAQELLDRILRDTHCFTGTLIDDILSFSKDFDLHLTQVREVLDRLIQAGLTANTEMHILHLMTL